MKTLITILFSIGVTIIVDARSSGVDTGDDIASIYRGAHLNGLENQPHAFVTFGATGDLAKKKIYPALWSLFRDNLLPNGTMFLGCGRTKLTTAEFRTRFEPYIQVTSSERARYEEFWGLNRYVASKYSSHDDFKLLNDEINKLTKGTNANRLFYLSIPPTAFISFTELIKANCMAEKGWNRVVIEKPFGKDTESSKKLSDHLAKLFVEEQIYRMDHYLGQEMVQNLLTFRFSNKIFSPTWNRDNIAAVMITLKEPFGVVGRGGYFDEYGMIRDVMQNHLLQVLSLIAMEKPTSSEAHHIRREKVKLLKSIDAIKLEDTVLGQYVGDPNGEGVVKFGYRDDPTVPDDSITPTFALSVLRINNERWDGVPFIMQSGKALNEHRGEIRIQYHDISGDIFGGKPKRNELVISIEPGTEAIYAKMMIKSPGNKIDIEETEMDLKYGNRYKEVKLPDPYEHLISDVFKGSQKHFVGLDEINEAWRIFTPLLHEIEDKQVTPISYLHGSSGPKEAYDKCIENNFKYYSKRP